MAVIHFTTDGFEKATEQGLTMIDFWAVWCGPCKTVGPLMDALAEEYEGKALIGKVDVDSEQELAVRYGVMSIPTIIYLKDGVEFDRKVGAMPKEAYAAVLDANL